MQQHGRADADRVALHRGDQRLFRFAEVSDEAERRTFLAISAVGLRSEVGQVVAGKLSPSPWNSTTLMALSVSARSRLSDSASYIAPVSAFFFSGRCNVRTRMPSISSAFTCSFIG